MGGCMQNSTQSVLEHCRTVRDRSIALYDYLETGDMTFVSGFKLPKWLERYRYQIYSNLAPDHLMMLYTEMHDCGKPYCKNVDESGKQHFPNHAKVSQIIWKNISDNDRIGQMILHDMDFHILKPENVPEFCKTPDCVTLMVVALAEIHANAEMFGGIDSTGFKIKFAQIERRGKRVCESLYPARALQLIAES